MRKTITPDWYQEETVKMFISHGAFGCLSDPGLGKTWCALTAFQILLKAKLVKRCLVICKKRPARRTWPLEIAKWVGFEDINYQVIKGTPSQKEKILAKGADLYVINPEGLQWLIKQDLEGFDMLIIDESSMFKHQDTLRFKTLKRMMPLFKRRYIMTGTPAPNGLLDLFGQVFILDWGETFGRFITYYRMTFFEDDPDNGYGWRLKGGDAEGQAKTEKRIYDRLKPLVIRHDVKEIADSLPERVEVVHRIEMPDAAKTLYDTFEREMVLDLEGGSVKAINAAVLTGKLRQIANGSVYAEGPEGRITSQIHDEKIEALEDLYEELQGSPLLVGYEFRSDLAKLKAKWPDVPHIGGGVKDADSDAILDKWNAGQLPMLFVQIESVSHGLNMQEGTCHTLAIYSASWDLEAMIQFALRVIRRGNVAKTVFVHWFLMRGTVDEVMYYVLGQKEKTQKRLLDALRQQITDREAFSESAEAGDLRAA